MPNTVSGQRLARNHPLDAGPGARRGHVRVFPIAAATRGSKGEAINDFAALKSAGAVAVTDDGRPILKDSIMRETLAAAARVGLSVIQHAEDTRMTQGACMNAGPDCLQAGPARHAA